MTNKELYKKYPHIVDGSIEEIPRGKLIYCGQSSIVSHGRIAIIKCANSDLETVCLKTRVINIQDAKQTKYCRLCTKRRRNERRRKSNTSDTD